MPYTRRSRLSAALGLVLAGCGPKASPTLSDAPLAAPTPTPAPAAAAFVCPLPKGTGSGEGCLSLGPELDRYVNHAIDLAIAEHPELFDFADNLGGVAYRVKDRDAYIATVVANLLRQQVCAIDDGDEIGVKTSNDFNEQWNVLFSEGYIRRSYISTCVPAWF